MISILNFNNKWYDVSEFEKLYSSIVNPFNPDCEKLQIIIEPRAGMLMDCILRLLCLCNQLATIKKIVILQFNGDINLHNTYTYFNRCGFFDNLDADVDVIPCVPGSSLAQLYNGNSQTLVEIAPIKTQPDKQDLSIPSKLCNRLMANIGIDDDNFSNELFTILGELCDNVWQHSNSVSPGFACLQFYGRTKKIIITVSDSGIGLLNSLRPHLATNYPELVKASDHDLVMTMFRDGLSSKPLETGRGAGLSRSSKYALAHNMHLHLRTSNLSVTLIPASTEYQANVAEFQNAPNHLNGTHISFEFTLNNLKI